MRTEKEPEKRLQLKRAAKESDEKESTDDPPEDRIIKREGPE